MWPYSILACLLISQALAVSVSIAGTIHVPGDFDTIQEAIDAAPPGSTVEVAPDVYTGDRNKNLDFGGKDLEVVGSGGAAVTVIDCEGFGRGFVFQHGETNAAVVDGFTIRNGFIPLPEAQGGGILCTNGSSATIRGCVIEDCWASNGSGMRVDGSPFVRLVDVSFLDNGQAFQGGGLECVNGANVEVLGCEFIDNDACCAALGGGIYAEASTITVEDCMFSGNLGEGGGGIALLDGAGASIRNSWFVLNSADNNGGGAILATGGSTLTLEGCKLYDNLAFLGSALNLSGGASGDAIGCTFADNHWQNDEPGESTIQLGDPLFGGGVQYTISNSIIAFGDGKAIDCSPSSAATLSCVDLFGNAGGDWVGCVAGQLGQNGNFAADPRFCDVQNGDLTLDASSPCLPGQHPDGAVCGLIGACSQGCGAIPVTPTTWGRMKADFLGDAR